MAKWNFRAGTSPVWLAGEAPAIETVGQFPSLQTVVEGKEG